MISHSVVVYTMNYWECGRPRPISTSPWILGQRMLTVLKANSPFARTPSLLPFRV